MRIVSIWPSRRGQGQSSERRAKLNFRPDYNRLHWRPPHINAIDFTELDSYDIRGLSAMISRNVTNDRIRYILAQLEKAVEGFVGFLQNVYLVSIMFSSITTNR